MPSLAGSSMTQSLRSASFRPLPAILLSTESWLVAWWKPAVWWLQFALAGAILAYPVELSPQSDNIPSVLPNLPLFAVVFSLWFACLLLLVFQPSGEPRATWERYILAVTAMLVVRGFWINVADI